MTIKCTSFIVYDMSTKIISFVISLNMVYWCIYVHMGMPERKVSNLLSHYSHYFWNKIFHWTWCSSIRVDCLIGAFRNPPVSSSLCCYYKRMPLHPAFYMGVEIWTQVSMLILLAPHSLQKWFLLSWTENKVHSHTSSFLRVNVIFT